MNKKNLELNAGKIKVMRFKKNEWKEIKIGKN